jgi:erythromycin esterase-like protein
MPDPLAVRPATYGHAVLTGAYPTCESDAVRVLTELLQCCEYAERDGERFMDAMQTARLIANAERYYRIMYYGSRASWNLCDSHMFETLKTLLAFYRPKSKAIIWVHNSHIGNAAATEMYSRGEYNLGYLCRKEFGDLAYAIGFGIHIGTVAAVSNWDGPMEIKTVLPALIATRTFVVKPEDSHSCCTFVAHRLTRRLCANHGSSVRSG